MKKVDIISNIVARKGEALATPSKDISKVNLSGYLLKSIWDKVWEIRTDSQGAEYIFGKLPVVTQYGITMYSGDGVDIPSLASGLPFDGRTIWYNPDTQQIEVIGGTGGGSGEGVSNFWDLSGIPSWITNSKPKYSYSEIEGTPDLSVYAQVDTLKAYVTLAGAQTLTGEKNFTGGLKVNGSPIIYDSANKYWKLQGNLVLTGGITMYADDGTLNLPSIYDGLPIDGTTIYWDTDAAGNRVLKAVGGGGTAESVAWNNITGKPTWIGSSKPAYSYSEIQGTPDLSVYALKTQIPSLSGYATESWVTKQNYATKATTLSGYGITDAYTKTNVDDLLKAYVTLTGTQTIAGEKNFTGGLKVNGSPIVYDTEKKYWKLEGDLLVTGGVTMYGSDSSFTPSTIMDAIAVDGTTISKSGGVLKVIGGTGGGVADSVAWGNITGKPTWIGSSKPSYSYSEITGAISTTELQNYLTSNSYLNVTLGDNRYLKLSGGVLTDLLTLQYSNPRIVFKTSRDEVFGSLGVFSGKFALYTNRDNKYNDVIHSGNYSSYALPLSGGEISGTLTISPTNIIGLQSGLILKDNGFGGYEALKIVWISTDSANENWLTVEPSNSVLLFNNYTVWHSGNDGTGSGLDADLLDGLHLFSPGRGTGGVANIGGDGVMEISSIIDFHSNNSDGNDFNTRLYSIGIYKNQVQLPTSSGTLALTTDNVASANILATSYSENINYGTYHSALKLIYNTNYNDYGFPYLYVSGLSVMAGYTGWQLLSYGGDVENPYFRSLQDTGTWKPWRQIAFLTDNVASATKLQTPRTIWGQSFDGTGDVDGDITIKGAILGKTSTTGALESYMGNASGGVNGDGALMYAYGSRNLYFYTKGTQRMIVDSSGNVGIGTESPSSKFHLSSTDNTTLRIQSDGSGGDQGAICMKKASGNGLVFAVENRDFIWQIGSASLTGDGTERMRLTNGGNVGVGIANPMQRLHIDGILRVQRYGDVNSYIDIQSNDISVNYKGYDKSDGYCHHVFYSNDTELVRFSGVDNIATFQGNILAIGGITMYSMRALKNVVDERGLSLSELSTIKPTRYTWKDGRDNRLHFGGIADDIQQVLPEVVYKTSDGLLTMDYGNAAFAVASSLIKPVVDHENRIAMLEEENKELRNEIERLKSA